MHPASRIIGLVTIAILLGPSAHGQSNLRVGFRAGFNTVAIFPEASYGQRKMDFKIPVRPSIGLSTDFRISSRSSIALDILYQRIGTKQEGFFKRKDFYKDIRLDYLVLPVTYRLTLNSPAGTFESAARSRDPKWYIGAGLQPGFLISANTTYEIDGNRTDFISFISEGGNPNFDQIEQNGTPDEARDLYNSFDLSVIGIAGVEIYIQRYLHVLIELRGGLSVLDINAEEWQLTDEKGNYYASRNMFFGVNMAVVFGD